MAGSSFFPLNELALQVYTREKHFPHISEASCRKAVPSVSFCFCNAEDYGLTHTSLARTLWRSHILIPKGGLHLVDQAALRLTSLKSPFIGVLSTGFQLCMATSSGR